MCFVTTNNISLNNFLFNKPNLPFSTKFCVYVIMSSEIHFLAVILGKKSNFCDW